MSRVQNPRQLGNLNLPNDPCVPNMRVQWSIAIGFDSWSWCKKSLDFRVDAGFGHVASSVTVWYDLMRSDAVQKFVQKPEK